MLNTIEGDFTLALVLIRKADGWQQMVATVYRPNDLQSRPQLWSEIMNLRNIIEGAFNVVRFEEERRGGDHNL